MFLLLIIKLQYGRLFWKDKVIRIINLTLKVSSYDIGKRTKVEAPGWTVDVTQNILIS